MAFLALRCSDFQTRHGGVSVGQVDELNHFSGQQLPLGEANTVSSLPCKSAIFLAGPEGLKGPRLDFFSAQVENQVGSNNVGSKKML